MIQMGSSEGNQLAHTALPSDTLVVIIKIQTAWSNNTVLSRIQHFLLVMVFYKGRALSNYSMKLYMVALAVSAHTITEFAEQPLQMEQIHLLSPMMHPHLVSQLGSENILLSSALTAARCQTGGQSTCEQYSDVWPVSLGYRRSVGHPCFHCCSFIGFLEI